MNKKHISLQVYSARNFKPYNNIFKFLSEQGIHNVELFEVETFDEIKDLLEISRKDRETIIGRPAGRIDIELDRVI